MISTVKHFALNAQETGRHVVNSLLSDAAAHDSDLLAFKIAIEIGQPGAVMCAYNRYNGPHACQSPYLLDDTLKKEWRFPGFVMSDWGAVRDVRDMLAGLDRQSGEELDDTFYFANDLLAAAEKDPALHARMRDAARRMLRSMFAAGLFDDPPTIEPMDAAAGDAVARDAAAAGIVLLKNRGVLPLFRGAQRVAVIGGYAHVGVMSGGGSSQVEPAAGPAIAFQPAEARRSIEIHPSPPLAAIKATLPKDARVRFNDGYSPAGAAALAADADVAIVFATQWMSEGVDAPDLALPAGAGRGDRRGRRRKPTDDRRSRDGRPGADALARRRRCRSRSLVSRLERRRSDRRRAVRRRESCGAAADHVPVLARAVTAAEARRHVRPKS